MKVYETRDLRNVALIGHGGSGKTSLAEAMLYDAGMTTRLGRVEEGNTVMDFEEEEKERRGSITSGIGFLEWAKCKINLIDTPGDANFVADGRNCLYAVDSVLLVADAEDGIRVQAEKMARAAEELGLTRVAYISKLDRERGAFETAMKALTDLFGNKAVPVFLPIGTKDAFHGVVDLLRGKAFLFDGEGKGTFQETEIPAEMTEQVAEARERLVEAASESDDELIEKYLENGELSPEELEVGLKKAIAQGSLIPVLCGSAPKNVGIRPMLDFLAAYLPAPHGERKGTNPDTGEEISRKFDDTEPFSALVFKTIVDEIGRFSVFRVISGAAIPDTTVLNPERRTDERLGQLFHLLGKERRKIEKASAGDIVAVARLKETITGDTLCDKKSPIRYPRIPVPPAIISFAVRPRSKADQDKISASLRKLMEEDTALRYERDEQTGEFLLSGMGQGHIEIVAKRLERKFKVGIELAAPKVAYLETIKGTADKRYRHKKQTGGAGQFGECAIKIEPNRGAGFEFVNNIVGGVIPGQYIPSVEKGVRDQMKKGVLAGYPVVDVKVTLYDGKSHPVDSKDIAFQLAGRKAMKEALLAAKPTLLEPIMEMEVVVPEEFMG
ncbi:MAG: elongation factor G, partial [Deltaproteobacteria bacterium]